MKSVNTFFVILILYFNFNYCSSSNGDKSLSYQKCLDNCTRFCTPGFQYNSVFILVSKLVINTCNDECHYKCMWHTIKEFKATNKGIPKFFGKWPFLRLWIIQEPAAAFFSLLNFLAHAVMLVKMYSSLLPYAPFYWLWHSYALISLNAWFWSVIFHVKETPLTEILDYYSAFSVVLYTLYAFFARYFYGTSFKLNYTFRGIFILFFVYHIYYMHRIKFDYGYNMKINLIIGTITVLAWTSWSLLQVSKQKYMLNCISTMLLLSVGTVLEVFDFPPIYFILDAHALWHLSTLPLPFMWYSYMIEDSLYIMRQYVSCKTI